VRRKVSLRTVPTFAVLLAGLFLTGCRSVNLYQLTEEIVISRDIELHRVAEDIWVHTTFADVPGIGRRPANGLVVVDGHEAMLIALPRTDQQTSQLLEWIAQKWGITVTTVIPIDFRDDSPGGLSQAHRPGAVSRALDRTVALAKQKSLPVPQDLYAGELQLHCRKTEVVVTHLGAGDTIDNVVAWMPHHQVLFGGRLVEPLSAASLGNTRDGDLDTYSITLQAVRDAYPKAKVVVPDHGDPGGLDLIDHTLTLCQRHSR
jgi:metallo-beta-lactamase class B